VSASEFSLFVFTDILQFPSLLHCLIVDRTNLLRVRDSMTPDFFA
jgi:hypothetical protein